MTMPTLSKDATKWIISSKADYRRADYLFPRTQSRQMKALEWEDAAETQPMTAWSRLVQFNIGFWALFGPFLYVGVFR